MPAYCPKCKYMLNKHVPKFCPECGCEIPMGLSEQVEKIRKAEPWQPMCNPAPERDTKGPETLKEREWAVSTDKERVQILLDAAEGNEAVIESLSQRLEAAELAIKSLQGFLDDAMNNTVRANAFEGFRSRTLHSLSAAEFRIGVMEGAAAVFKDQIMVLQEKVSRLMADPVGPTIKPMTLRSACDLSSNDRVQELLSRIESIRELPQGDCSPDEMIAAISHAIASFMESDSTNHLKALRAARNLVLSHKHAAPSHTNNQNSAQDRFDKDEYPPCTCPLTCKPDCHGECGCEAHRLAYSDFLSTDYD